MHPLFLADRSIRIDVNRSHTLSRLIEAGGFRFAHPKITSERFPMNFGERTTADIRFVMIERNQRAGTPEILDWMSGKGLRAADLVDLLSMAAAVPRIFLPRIPRALGSIWQDANGEAFVVGCGLTRERVLRFSHLRWEPWWSAASDCFPCVAA